MPRLEKGQVPHETLLTIRTAHDVRRLRNCPGCKNIGQNDSMVLAWPYRKTGDATDAYYHGRCFVAEFGFEALADMPDQIGKLSIGDLGVDLMRRVLAIKDKKQ